MYATVLYVIQYSRFDVWERRVNGCSFYLQVIGVGHVAYGTLRVPLRASRVRTLQSLGLRSA